MENSLTLFDNQKLLPQLASTNTQIMILQNSIQIMGDAGKKAEEKMDWDKFHKGIQGATKAIQAINAPGMAFEQQMAALSAATGITGNDLDSMGEQARQTGMKSGLGATQAVNAYKVLTTQIDVSKIGINGLNNLQQKTMTLAKASGMDVESAAGSLATTINSFGLKASEAGRAVNVLAAGAKFGSMDVNQLSQAFDAAGATASAAGVSMEATTGALGVLSQNNLKGAEAGAALSDIMQKMQTSLGVDFSNTSLSDSLDSLKPKLNDINYLNQVFGEKNSQAAQFLIANSAAVGEMTNMVTGSNVAQEQAAVRSQTMADRMAVIRQTVDNLKIGFFNLTGGAFEYVGALGEAAGGAVDFISSTKEICKGILYLTKLQNLQAIWTGIVDTATAIWTSVQWALNAAFLANPLTWIIALIAALVGAIVWVCSNITGWGSLWNGLVGYMKYSFLAFIEEFSAKWTGVTNDFMIGINKLMTAWYKFRNAVGLGDENENNAALAKISADTVAREKAIGEANAKVLEYRKLADQSLAGIEMGWEKKETNGEKETAAAIAEEAAGGPALRKGVSTAGVPGAANSALVPTNQTTSPDTVRQSSESAVTGGTKSSNVTINLGKLMDNVNIYAQEFREGLNDLDSKVLDSLTRVLTIAQSNVG